MKAPYSTFLLYVIVLTVCTLQSVSQITPFTSLGLVPVQVEIPSRFASLTGNRSISLNLPPGFTAKVFAANSGFQKPRFMAWSPDSVLHITDMSARRIFAMPDRDRDGVADTVITVASNVTAHSIQFYEGALYAAEERQVLRFTDSNGDGLYENRAPFIANIAEGATQPGGGHTTRTIVFDPARKKAYLSIGSLCNVCRSQNPGDVDFGRASIEEFNDNGTGRRLMASGVRNAVGMTLHPRTGKLWATNNGSDQQGNDIPPEWIDIIRDGGFYGYPFAWYRDRWFDFNRHQDYRPLLPIRSADSALVSRIATPGALVQAHSAPMAIEFANGAFPSPFSTGAFVAFRGSWNRSPRTGYKIVYMHLENDQDTIANYYADFLTGFHSNPSRDARLTDSSTAPWARPVGLASDLRGNLYVGTDDGQRFVLLISPPKPSSTNEGNGKRQGLHIHPNPGTGLTTVVFGQDMADNSTLSVFSLQGQKVLAMALDGKTNQVSIDCNNLPAGHYNVRVESGSQVLTAPLQVVR